MRIRDDSEIRGGRVKKSQRLGILPQDPAPVLAHDGQAMEDDRLSGCDDGAQSAGIEPVCESKIDVHGAMVTAAKADVNFLWPGG